MNSFLSWVGGKMLLRDDIIARFPGSFETYAEVFCGAAWVFFRKQRSKIEAINDMNSNLANLYWQVQENADALCERLRYAIDCEAIFYHIRDTLKSGAPLDDLTRAAWFYQLLRYSYGSKCTSYNGRGHDIWRDFPTLTGAHHRLRGVGVHNKEFEHFIKLMDALGTFFYCDPPYWGTPVLFGLGAVVLVGGMVTAAVFLLRRRRQNAVPAFADGIEEIPKKRMRKPELLSELEDDDE